MLGGHWARPGLLRTSLKALDRRAGGRTAIGLACRHRRCFPLQKQERRRAGGGFARSRSDA